MCVYVLAGVFVCLECDPHVLMNGQLCTLPNTHPGEVPGESPNGALCAFLCCACEDVPSRIPFLLHCSCLGSSI